VGLEKATYGQRLRGCPQAICSEHKNTKTDLSRSKKAPKYLTPTTGAKEGQKQETYLSRLSASTQDNEDQTPNKTADQPQMKIGPVPVVGLARHPYGKGPQQSGGHAAFERFFMEVLGGAAWRGEYNFCFFERPRLRRRCRSSLYTHEKSPKSGVTA